MDLRDRGLLVLFFGRIYAIFFYFVGLLVSSKKDKNVFGGAAIVKYGRWSRALVEAGIESTSIVPSIYSINSVEDFDITWLDLLPKKLRGMSVGRFLAPGIAWLWIIRHAKVTCSPVGGISFFRWVGLEKIELFELKRRGIKTIVITGGGDSYMLGLIKDPSLKFALQMSYPDRSKLHLRIERSVRLWERGADIFVANQMYLDGFARSDFAIPHLGAVNVDSFALLRSGNQKAKQKGRLVIGHAPNHRYFKGTNFIENIIEELQNQGYDLEFKIFEKVKNEDLLKEIVKVDIVVDQLIMPGYTNFAIECMALGIPTIVNMGNEDFRKYFTRYSILASCPLIHSDPETLQDTIKLILEGSINLDLISTSGIEYVTNFHSYESWVKTWKFWELHDFNGRMMSTLNYFDQAGKSQD